MNLYNLHAHHLIEASAGTGKTYTLEQLVLQLIEQRGLALSEILLVTFTDKAARELKARIRHKLTLRHQSHPHPLLGHSLDNFDSAAIYTIHGFASRILKEFPVESGFSPTSELSLDRRIREDFIRDYFRKNFYHLEQSGYCFFLKSTKSFDQGIRMILDIHAQRASRVQVEPSPARIEQARAFGQQFDSDTSPLRLALVSLEHFASRLPELQAWLIAEKFPHLKATSYKEKSLRQAFRALEHLLQARDLFSFAQVMEKDADDLFKLSTTSIEKNLKKSAAGVTVSEFLYPNADLFKTIDQLIRMWQPFCDEGDLAASQFSRMMATAFALDVEAYLREGLAAYKRSLNIHDYDDLISILHRQIQPDSPLTQSIRSKYQVALIDEFQDTDQTQWDIFYTIFNHPGKNLFLVGDPKQSIYRFRGADLEVYFRARQLMPPDQLHALRFNYRSSETMIQALNTLSDRLFAYYTGQGSRITFEQAVAPKVPGDTRSFLFPDSPPVVFMPIQQPGEAPLRSLPLKARIYDRIAREIGDLLNDPLQPVLPQQIAVLTEKNRECEEVQQVLLNHNIPALIMRHPDLFQSQQARELMWVMAAICYWQDRSRLLQALLTPYFDLTYDQILAFSDSGALIHIQEFFSQLKALIDEGNLITAYDRLARYTTPTFPERMLASLNGERALTNARQIIERLHLEQRRENLDASGLHDLLITLISGQGRDEEPMRLDREQNCIQIMSMHNAKGLQFQVVFIAGGFTSLRSPDYYQYYDQQQGSCLDLIKTKAHQPDHLKATWEEKKRLLYVAFTRAQSRLYLPFAIKEKFESIMEYFYFSLLAPLLQQQNALALHPLETLFAGEPKTIRPLLTEASLFDHLQSFCALQPHAFAIRDAGTLSAVADGCSRPAAPDLACRLWHSTSGLVTRRQYLSSFSSLSSGQDHHLNFQDNLAEVESDQPLASPTLQRRLPGGPLVGDLIHQLLERLDFSLFQDPLTLCQINTSLQDKITKIILMYFDQTWADQYGDAVLSLLWNTLNKPLYLGDAGTPLILADLPSQDRRSEIEFLLKVNGTDNQPLFVDEYTRLKPVGAGYLKGFIDLTFLYHGKYYILDWKTNILGDQPEDYHDQSIAEKMLQHRYYGQYYLYTSAIYHYLKKQSPDFSYDQHFGGCLYLFLRGLDAHDPATTGVYFDRPSEQQMLRFSAQFISVTGGPDAPM